MNTKTNPNAGETQACGNAVVPKKRVFWLVVGWVAAGYALYFGVDLLSFNWTFMAWSPKADALSVSLLSGIPVLLAGIWFLAKGSRDRLSKTVSALVCLALAATAMKFAIWFPLFAFGKSLWFARANSLVLCLPAGFWLWNLSLPDVTRATRLRIIAIASCVLILVGAAFNAWIFSERIKTAANAPKAKDLGDQVMDAFADALMKGGPAPKPDPKAWQRIRVGQSREEVLAILGQPATKTKPNSPATAAPGSNSSHEWWEYGYSSPIGTGAVDPRAYALFFDDTGHVTSFQEPSEPAK